MNSRFLSITGLVLLAAISAKAQSTVTTSTSKLPAPKPSLLKEVQIGVFGWSYGPAFGNFDGSTPNSQGPQTNSSNATTQLAISAPISEQWRAVVIPSFILEPFSQTASSRLLNPTVGVQGTVFTNGAFTYWTRFEAALPATDVSYRDGLVVGPQTVQVVSYRQPDSPWEAQGVVVPGTSFFKNGENNGFLYLSPMVSYHINREWRIAALSEHFFGRERGSNISRLIETQPDMIGLGVRKTWFIGEEKTLFFQPYVNTFPDRIAADNAHIAFLFGGRLL